MAVERIQVSFPASATVEVQPPDDGGAGPHPLLLAVHGYGQPPEEMLRYAASVAPGAVVAAPHGPSAFARRGPGHRRPAFGWIAADPRDPEDARNTAYLAAALDALTARPDVDGARVGLLAFSQGVGVVTHFLATHPGRARCLVGLAGGFAAAYRERLLPALAGVPVLWITGRQDAAYPPAYTDALVEAARAAGVAIEDQALDAGHDLLESARTLVAPWLEAQGV